MRKEIVFDSSTAILLAKIGLLEETSKKFGIYFSEKVREETTKRDSFDSNLITKLINDKKIEIIKADKLKVRKLVEDFNIDIGEAEALEIAKENGFILATDDGPSIKVCKILHIKFATAIHFLVYFHKVNLIETNIILEKLKLLEKYGRYNYEIIKDAKNKIGGE